MTKKQWINRIKKCCEEVDTYREAFDDVISTLAETLSIRDEAMKLYNGNPLVKHTNSHGETNVVKNPALMLYESYNNTALSYWRDLGLTPAGLKRIDDNKKKKKVSALADALKDLNG